VCENTTRMFMLESEEALKAAFRPKDLKLVELSSEMKLPMFVRDYLAWTHPAGGRVYLIFAVANGAPTGIVFDGKSGSGASPAMCDWCHCSSVGTGVALLTAQLNAKKRVGVHVCWDLSCKQKLEDDANRSGRSVLPAMEKLIARMGRFASEALKIDLVRG
jgi:hypothetical protein